MDLRVHLQMSVRIEVVSEIGGFGWIFGFTFG